MIQNHTLSSIIKSSSSVNTLHSTDIASHQKHHIDAYLQKTIKPSNIRGVSAIYSPFNPKKPNRSMNMRQIEKTLGIHINYFENSNYLQSGFLGLIKKYNWTGIMNDDEHYPHAGCFLSHVYFWRKVVDLKLEFALIFEDDIDIERGFK